MGLVCECITILLEIAEFDDRLDDCEDYVGSCAKSNNRQTRLLMLSKLEKISKNWNLQTNEKSQLANKYWIEKCVGKCGFKHLVVELELFISLPLSVRQRHSSAMS